MLRKTWITTDRPTNRSNPANQPTDQPNQPANQRRNAPLSTFPRPFPKPMPRSRNRAAPCRFLRSCSASRTSTAPSACLPACPPACLPACLLACLPTHECFTSLPLPLISRLYPTAPRNAKYYMTEPSVSQRRRSLTRPMGKSILSRSNDARVGSRRIEECNDDSAYCERRYIDYIDYRVTLEERGRLRARGVSAEQRRVIADGTLTGAARATPSHTTATTLWIIHVSAPPPRRSDTCTVCIHAAAARLCVGARRLDPSFAAHSPITSTLSSARARARVRSFSRTCVQPRDWLLPARRACVRRNGIFDGTPSLYEASRCAIIISLGNISRRLE